MMRKARKIGLLTLCVALLIGIFSLPVTVDARTLAEFEAEVARFTRELEEKQSRIAQNDREVAEIRVRIREIEGQIGVIRNSIISLEAEITRNNELIAQKEEESKRLIQHHQLSSRENAYLEYAFGADSITDMIFRLAVVEQLTEHNTRIMEELNRLIDANNAKREELSTQRGELERLQRELESERARIEEDTASIRHTMPNLQQQIDAARANVRYFRNLGCRPNENLQACQFRIMQQQQNSGGGGGSIPSTSGWFRPMEHGFITQPYRGIAHMGIDLSSSNRSIPIFPVASGQVWFVGRDIFGGNVVKIRHNHEGRFLWTTYAHMASINPELRVGDFISHNTLIGPMGSTGNSTGPHLHLEITTCDWNPGGGCTWAQYQRSTINPSTLIHFPSSWTNR